MSGRLAIVFCVHHKPWLIMSTLLTLVSQPRQEADCVFIYNIGNGETLREGYAEYRRLAAREGVNTQLSPFDGRVREVCHIRGWNVSEIEYENDHGLDSGCWYKFIRDGRWRDYEYVLFVGEGTLFAHPRVLPALMAFAERRGVHFIASGHEKRRMSRSVMDLIGKRGQAETPMDAFHVQRINETYEIFCRDREFGAVYDRWKSNFDVDVETEHHVPDVTRGKLRRRARARIQKEWGPLTNRDVPWAGRPIWNGSLAIDRWSSRVHLALGHADAAASEPMAYVGGSYEVRPITGASEIQTEAGVTFHRVDGPEWFGCATNHLMSREFLNRFSEKLSQFGMYDVIDLPFAGSALEMIWGMLPAWLGFDKWFTNGFHRVRKNFATYQREDYPPEMASYINRYYKGRLAVGWEGDYLKLKAWRSELGDLRQILPAAYFPEHTTR